MKLLLVTEGTNLSTNLFVNEATMQDLNTRNFRHFFVDPPAGMRLTKGENTTEWYTRTKLGGKGLQHWTLPGMTQEGFLRMIKFLQRDTIFCVGNVAVTWLRSLLGANADIRNLGDMGFTYPKTLPAANCGVFHRCARRCSFAKLNKAREFLERNPQLWE